MGVMREESCPEFAGGVVEAAVLAITVDVGDIPEWGVCADGRLYIMGEYLRCSGEEIGAAPPPPPLADGMDASVKLPQYMTLLLLFPFPSCARGDEDPDVGVSVIGCCCCCWC